MSKQTVGENVTIERKGKQIIITIDAEHRGDVSSSGKTRRVASTLGNQKIDGTEIVLGLNAYVKA